MRGVNTLEDTLNGADTATATAAAAAAAECLCRVCHERTVSGSAYSITCSGLDVSACPVADLLCHRRLRVVVVVDDSPARMSEGLERLPEDRQ